MHIKSNFAERKDNHIEIFSLVPRNPNLNVYDAEFDYMLLI